MTSDFERALRARGAELEPVHGVTLPARFGDPGREWRAAREGGVVFAAGFRALLAATGEDRITFLQGMLSNDVKALAPGHGVYAAMLTQQGKVVADLRVYAMPDRLLLDVVAWRRTILHEALERFLVADDVELGAPDEEPLIGLEGPLARAIAGEALGLAALPQQRYAHVHTVFESAAVTVVAASELDREGILLIGSPDVAPALFEACVEAGAQPCGMQTLDVLRVEAGVPWAGVDMDESTLIMETGRTAAISYTKGCYLGQEVVERVSARGHVNRRLSGLVVGGDTLPAPGARVRVGDHEVGSLTSAVQSPEVGGVIGLAMLRLKECSPGQQVTVDAGGSAIAATVAALPFAAATSD